MKRTSVLGLSSLVALTLALALFAAGCASTGKIDEFPQSVEMTVETVPSEPDRIDFIEVSPWELKPGESATVTVKGTENRKATVVLRGVDGEAAGKTIPVELSPGAGGAYTGKVTASPGLAPGRYRIEAVMTGGPTGEPTKLVSSRALSIIAPPPPPDPCELAMKDFLTPRVTFDFDKADLDDADKAALAEIAAKLRELGPRVKTFTIEGHCDERGTIEYNLALGGRRAMAVRDYLQGLPGLSNLNAATLSRGEEQPVVPNAKTEDEHAKNRRAVFVLECRDR